MYYPANKHKVVSNVLYYKNCSCEHSYISPQTVSLQYILRNLLEDGVYACLTLINANLFPKVDKPTPTQQCLTDPSTTPEPHQHLILPCFKLFSNVVSIKWYLIFILICISLITNKVEHLFILHVAFLFCELPIFLLFTISYYFFLKILLCLYFLFKNPSETSRWLRWLE